MSEITSAEAQEIEATDGYGVAELNGISLRIKSVSHWRPSYMRALRQGDYDGWAAGVLHEDDVQLFIDEDATFDEINAFTTAAMEAVGETPGKSGARSRSSRSTRKR
ncbi:hypothetical protein [Streptomyces albipurpureus]|uniref:Uncharacterized protein n=1 Tax=Streptomyces albipurpureus TaxID=2897419 RepID=A0ABT0UTJ0_9ACTN|nr:hypothetical protein [Streptomyces sp. CWNU-1]MCM2391711.1 hypothetical protein [Streptomyces sp. CWNU-1]